MNNNIILLPQETVNKGLLIISAHSLLCNRTATFNFVKTLIHFGLFIKLTPLHLSLNLVETLVAIELAYCHRVLFKLFYSSGTLNM